MGLVYLQHPFLGERWRSTFPGGLPFPVTVSSHSFWIDNVDSFRERISSSNENTLAPKLEWIGTLWDVTPTGTSPSRPFHTTAAKCWDASGSITDWRQRRWVLPQMPSVVGWSPFHSWHCQKFFPTLSWYLFLWSFHSSVLILPPRLLRTCLFPV